jgi:hypothetical protein
MFGLSILFAESEHDETAAAIPRIDISLTSVCM